MPELMQLTIPYNTGKAFVVGQGGSVRIFAHSIVDYIGFNADDLKERFSQATTKEYCGKIFVTKDDGLYSNRHNRMMTIMEDGFPGMHDLQCEMCSKRFYDRHFELFQAGDKAILDTFGDWITVATRSDLPDHGCLENMLDALQGTGLAPEDIPSPFDMFQNTEIVGPEGKMLAASKKAFLRLGGEPAQIVLQAEMTCLVVLSACPNFYAPESFGQSVTVQISG